MSSGTRGRRGLTAREMFGLIAVALAVILAPAVVVYLLAMSLGLFGVFG